MFLFIIGLEMRPSRLWSLRAKSSAWACCRSRLRRAADTGRRRRSASPAAVSFVAGAGFVLTSTAIVMQMLEERGEISTPKGQRIVSILLLEDLAIVPLLALVVFLAPSSGDTAVSLSRLIGGRHRLGSIAALIVAGRYLLNPMFRILADAQAREVMTAAALARRARRCAGYAAWRAFDGHGRVPRRRAAVGIDLPPSARGRCRAVPRHPARPVLHGRRHVARPQRRRGELAAGRNLCRRSTWS
jgi:predicted Kef-type K+ transport protein